MGPSGRNRAGEAVLDGVDRLFEARWQRDGCYSRVEYDGSIQNSVDRRAEYRVIGKKGALIAKINEYFAIFDSY